MEIVDIIITVKRGKAKSGKCKKKKKKVLPESRG